MTPKIRDCELTTDISFVKVHFAMSVEEDALRTRFTLNHFLESKEIHSANVVPVTEAIKV